MRDLAEILETFDLLGDWDQRYQYLIELGEQLPPMPDALKTEENRVKPCMSSVYVSAYADASHPERVRYFGDCDSAVIKGALALLIDLFSGRRPEEIAEMDTDALFEQLQLAEHLSPNRHVGVYAIVDLMKAQAQRLQKVCVA